MKSDLMKLGYRDTFERGDPQAPVLEEEMKKFKGKITKAQEQTSFYDRIIFSAVTPYGKQQIKEAFYFRIFNDDLPMTYLWRHPGHYFCRFDSAPIYQADKKSPPVEGQKGGWCRDRSGKLEEIPKYIKWNSYGRKVNAEGKKIRLEEGELCSNATIPATIYSRFKNYGGMYEAGPHYMIADSDKNAYVGDVKSAILASCLDNKDKQELLDAMYQWKDPVKEKDNYFINKLKRLKGKESSQKKVIEEEIKNCNVLTKRIKENLLLNLECYCN